MHITSQMWASGGNVPDNGTLYNLRICIFLYYHYPCTTIINALDLAITFVILDTLNIFFLID